jgi:hypothetical protein
VANRELPLSGSRPQGLEFKALLTELRPERSRSGPQLALAIRVPLARSDFVPDSQAPSLPVQQAAGLYTRRKKAETQEGLENPGKGQPASANLTLAKARQ